MICAQARGPLACAPASRRAAIPVTRSLRARVLERAREQTQSDLDAEAARLEKVDAFEELKSLAAKQSVNRRQKAEDLVFRQTPTFEDCYPGSTKEYKTVQHNGTTLRVPFRRVHLTNGSTFDLYDTSGPRVDDPRAGLPKLRGPWVAAREAAGHETPTQM